MLSPELLHCLRNSLQMPTASADVVAERVEQMQRTLGDVLAKNHYGDTLR